MLLAIILLFIFFRQLKQQEEGLYCFIKAIVGWMIILYVGVEVLSIGKGISELSMRLFWGIVDVFFILYITFRYRRDIIKKNDKKVSLQLSLAKIILILFAALLIAYSFYIAITIAPYNWDSLTYHLPRIMHWAQNGSIAHYATNISRQVSSPVLAEFVNLSVYLVWGKNDLFFNLVQWGAYVVCGWLVMGIAKKLQCSATWRYIAGVLFYSMPIAFAEAFTTQNDLFAAMWLLIFIYILLDLYENPKLSFDSYCVERTILLSLSIAFSYLAKPSVMFEIVIFAIGLLLLCIKHKSNMQHVIKLLICSAVIMMSVILPETLRVVFTFEALSDPIVGNRQLIGTLNPLYMFVNMLKNFLYNAPNAYININDFILSILFFFSHHLGVVLDHPSISEDGEAFRIVDARTFHHNSALSTVLFWAIIVTFVIFVLTYRKIKLNEIQKLYFILSIISFIILCIFLRWEAYVARYMISYLAPLCVAVVMVLERAAKCERLKAWGYSVIGIIMFLSTIESINMVKFHSDAVKYAWANERGQEYFYICGEGNYGDYLEVVDYIEENQCYNIGLLTGYNTFEYPLWQYLPKERYTLKHIGVKNGSSKYEDSEYIPDCIFVRDIDVDILEYHGIEYIRENPEGKIGTYLLIPNVLE